jgi:hypothetical protein
MQRMFSAFPEIIFVDATCKLNDMRMPLYVMILQNLHEKRYFRIYYIQTNASTEIKKMKMINAISN